MSLAPYIHALGRGPSRARSLTADEVKPLLSEHRRLASRVMATDHLRAVWHGDCEDLWAEAIVIGTASAALKAHFPDRSLEDTETEARALWRDRSGQMAA